MSRGQDYKFDHLDILDNRFTVSGSVYVEEDEPFADYGCHAEPLTVRFSRVDRNEVDGLTAFDDMPQSHIPFDEWYPMALAVCEQLNKRDNGAWLELWFQENVIDAYK